MGQNELTIFVWTRDEPKGPHFSDLVPKRAKLTALLRPDIKFLLLRGFMEIVRGVTPIRQDGPLARGPEGLGGLERANVYVRDQDLF